MKIGVVLDKSADILKIGIGEKVIGIKSSEVFDASEVKRSGQLGVVKRAEVAFNLGEADLPTGRYALIEREVIRISSKD